MVLITSCFCNVTGSSSLAVIMAAYPSTPYPTSSGKNTVTSPMLGFELQTTSSVRRLSTTSTLQATLTQPIAIWQTVSCVYLTLRASEFWLTCLFLLRTQDFKCGSPHAVPVLEYDNTTVARRWIGSHWHYTVVNKLFQRSSRVWNCASHSVCIREEKRNQHYFEQCQPDH